MQVARESYALTLWTWWVLVQQQRREWIDRRFDRFDLAGLFAAAQHEPKKLAEQFEVFQNEVTVSPNRSSDPDARNAKLRKLLADHRKLVPIPPPEA